MSQQKKSKNPSEVKPESQKSESIKPLNQTSPAPKAKTSLMNFSGEDSAPLTFFNRGDKKTDSGDAGK